jgi:uncharacterized protein YjlB
MTERLNTNPHVRHFVLERIKNFPNSALPVLIYQGALNLPAFKKKSAEIVQHIFARNGWGNSWTNGIYDFHHYHSNTHEAIAICLGSANVILGGPGGRGVKLEQNDVMILPAGVAHKCTKCSDDFQCVGAYPGGNDYNMNTGSWEEYEKALPVIEKLPLPEKDPVFGEEGFLKLYWKSGK